MVNNIELIRTIITTIITIMVFITTSIIPISPEYGENPVLDLIVIIIGYLLVVIGTALSLIGWLIIISEWRSKQIAK